MGTCFDAIIKDYLAKKKGINNPILKLDRVFKEIKHEDKDAVIANAYVVAGQYIKHGLADKLLASQDIKLEQELYRVINGVPILGRLDAILDGLPFDWKTRGFYSKYTASPHANYAYKVSGISGEVTAPNTTPLFDLEEINPAWATQLIFYNWLVGKFSDFYFRVHEVCHQKKDIIFVEYEGTISDEFANKLFGNVKKMWEQIHDDRYNATIAEPQPSYDLCHEYNCQCEAAVYCKSYERWLERSSKDELELA